MRMRVVDVDVERCKDKVSNAVEAALGIVAENVLADCKTYIPYDSGALQGSGTTRQTGSAAYVEWGAGDAAAYARVQYYSTHNHSTLQNALHAPNACDHWYDRCAGVRGNAWQQMFAKVIGEKVGGAW